jgi:hypothetical protein
MVRQLKCGGWREANTKKTYRQQIFLPPTPFFKEGKRLKI